MYYPAFRVVSLRKKVRETSACINGSSTEILTMNIPTTNPKVLTLNQSARYIGQKPSEVNKHGEISTSEITICLVLK